MKAGRRVPLRLGSGHGLEYQLGRVGSAGVPPVAAAFPQPFAAPSPSSLVQQTASKVRIVRIRRCKVATANLLIGAQEIYRTRVRRQVEHLK